MPDLDVLPPLFCVAPRGVAPRNKASGINNLPIRSGLTLRASRTRLILVGSRLPQAAGVVSNHLNRNERLGLPRLSIYYALFRFEILYIKSDIFCNDYSGLPGLFLLHRGRAAGQSAQCHILFGMPDTIHGMWGRIVSCAPVFNRRRRPVYKRFGRVANPMPLVFRKYREGC